MWSDLAAPAEPGLEEAGTEPETVDDDRASGPAAVTAATAECPAENDRKPYENEMKKCEQQKTGNKRKDPVILQVKFQKQLAQVSLDLYIYLSLVSFHILLMTDYIWLNIQIVFA